MLGGAREEVKRGTGVRVVELGRAWVSAAGAPPLCRLFHKTFFGVVFCWPFPIVLSGETWQRQRVRPQSLALGSGYRVFRRKHPG